MSFGDLDAARAALGVVRLLYAARRHAVRFGVQIEPAEVRRVEELGARLGQAVSEAEAAPEGSEERAAAVERAAALADEVSSGVLPSDSVRGLLRQAAGRMRGEPVKGPPGVPSTVGARRRPG